PKGLLIFNHSSKHTMENISSQTSSEAFDKEHSYNSDDKESESEYEEETSYIILDLGTEATLDIKYHFSQNVLVRRQQIDDNDDNQDADISGSGGDGESEKVKDDITYSLI
ncbi:14869_t:CDS:2, partial [Racocetra persica]